jgi:hypothetical protein
MHQKQCLQITAQAIQLNIITGTKIPKIGNYQHNLFSFKETLLRQGFLLAV